MEKRQATKKTKGFGYGDTSNDTLCVSVHDNGTTFISVHDCEDIRVKTTKLKSGTKVKGIDLYADGKWVNIRLFQKK